MSFTFKYRDPPCDVSFLSVIDGEKLYNTQDRYASEVKEATIRQIGWHPIQVSQDWFLSSQGYETVSKVIQTLQCTIQYLHHLASSLQKENTKYHQEIKQTASEREASFEEIVELREKLALFKKRFKLLESEEHSRGAGGGRGGGGIPQLSGLACTLCGNVYPNPHALSSHLRKRHRRPEDFADMAACSAAVNHNTAAQQPPPPLPTAAARQAEAKMYPDGAPDQSRGLTALQTEVSELRLTIAKLLESQAETARGVRPQNTLAMCALPFASGGLPAYTETPQSQANDAATRRLLKEKDDQIRFLQKQMDRLQESNTAALSVIARPAQTYATLPGVDDYAPSPSKEPPHTTVTVPTSPKHPLTAISDVSLSTPGELVRASLTSTENVSQPQQVPPRTRLLSMPSPSSSSSSSLMRAPALPQATPSGLAVPKPDALPPTFSEEKKTSEEAGASSGPPPVEVATGAAPSPPSPDSSSRSSTSSSLWNTGPPQRKGTVKNLTTNASTISAVGTVRSDFSLPVLLMPQAKPHESSHLGVDSREHTPRTQRTNTQERKVLPSELKQPKIALSPSRAETTGSVHMFHDTSSRSTTSSVPEAPSVVVEEQRAPSSSSPASDSGAHVSIQEFYQKQQQQQHQQQEAPLEPPRESVYNYAATGTADIGYGGGDDGVLRSSSNKKDLRGGHEVIKSYDNGSLIHAVSRRETHSDTESAVRMVEDTTTTSSSQAAPVKRKHSTHSASGALKVRPATAGSGSRHDSFSSVRSPRDRPAAVSEITGQGSDGRSSRTPLRNLEDYRAFEEPAEGSKRTSSVAKRAGDRSDEESYEYSYYYTYSDEEYEEGDEEQRHQAEGGNVGYGAFVGGIPPGVLEGVETSTALTSYKKKGLFSKLFKKK